MAEASTASKAKTSKSTAPSFEMPSFEIPKFDMPKMEVPAAFRDMAEKSISQAKDTYEKMKAAAEEATDLLEDTYATTTKGVSDYGLKVIEVARTNAELRRDVQLTMHPHVSGHRSRIVVLERLIAHMKRAGQCWFATHQDVAEWCRKSASAP